VSAAVATFPPASLQAQLDELRRERLMRDRAYPHMVASRKLDQAKADHNNRGLDGAIVTLERLVEARQRGEPGRKELIGALRESLLYLPTGMGPAAALHARIIDMLSRVPE
jgi:hypothetical protein